MSDVKATQDAEVIAEEKFLYGAEARTFAEEFAKEADTFKLFWTTELGVPGKYYTDEFKGTYEDALRWLGEWTEVFDATSWGMAITVGDEMVSYHPPQCPLSDGSLSADLPPFVDFVPFDNLWGEDEDDNE